MQTDKQTTTNKHKQTKNSKQTTIIQTSKQANKQTNKQTIANKQIITNKQLHSSSERLVSLTQRNTPCEQTLTFDALSDSLASSLSDRFLKLSDLPTH